MSQKSNILNHLKSGKSITPLEALQEYGRKVIISLLIIFMKMVKLSLNTHC